MLAPVAFLLTILVLATGVAVAGIGAAARASLHAAAHAAIAPAFHHAVDGYQAQIAALIASQLAAAPPEAASSVASVAVPPALADPATIAAPARITESIPPFVVTEDVTNTTLAAPSCTDSGATAPGSGNEANDPDTVVAAQCSPWVAESRLSASIVVNVWGSDPAANPGARLLAQETETVAFRLVADAPYAMVAGVKTGDARDPADDSVVDPSAHEGDADGYSTAVAPVATPPGDTTIHVTYQCQPSAANQACPYTPLSNSPGDDPTALPWQNGNAQPAPGAP
jgi:hypothetical protein